MSDQDMTNGSEERGEDQRMSARLIYVLSHPLRRRLLRAFNSSSEPLSPSQLSKDLGADLTRTAYHVRIIALQGAAVRAGVRRVRGVHETLYASTVAKHKQMVAILADTARDDDASR